MKEFQETNYTCVENASGELMFETYGEDFEVVKSYNVKNVWTILDSEDGELVIIPGLHFVNRINYVITEEEWGYETEEYLW